MWFRDREVGDPVTPPHWMLGRLRRATSDAEAQPCSGR